MTMASLVTADELLASPEHQKHCELVNGEIVEMSPAGGYHGEVTITISYLLTSYIRQRKLGKCVAAETGFVLRRDPDTVRAPDFAYIPKSRIPESGISTKFLTLVPALVVEVLSPDDRALAVADKIQDWLRFGVEQVWVVNPHLKQITVHAVGSDPHSFGEGDVIPGDPVLPGLDLAVAEVFAR